MATPLKPLQSKSELIRALLEEYPTLTREKLLEEAKAFGFDLTEDEPPAKPGGTNSSKSD
jgi:hypothetical protein